MPATLGEAIATEPMWLQAWLNVLGVVGTGSLCGKWINAYLVVVDISLAIDVVDLIRCFPGDGELLHRWSQAVG